MGEAGEFEVTVRKLDEASTLVRVSGEVDMATSSELESALEKTEPGERVVVDLTACTFLDSSAIRALLTGAARLEAGGGSVALVAPDPRIRRVLEIAGLDERLPIHPTLDAAS